MGKMPAMNAYDCSDETLLWLATTFIRHEKAQSPSLRFFSVHSFNDIKLCTNRKTTKLVTTFYGDIVAIHTAMDSILLKRVGQMIIYPRFIQIYENLIIFLSPHIGFTITYWRTGGLNETKKKRKTFPNTQLLRWAFPTMAKKTSFATWDERRENINQKKEIQKCWRITFSIFIYG